MRTTFPTTVCVLLALSAAALAQPAPPQIGVLNPDTVQRGHSAEVSIAGVGLQGVTSVVLPDAQGVSVELLKAEPNGVKVKVSVAADAELGKREIRVIAPTGASNPLGLHVSQYPPAYEIEPNNSSSQPQPAQLPAILIGTINGPGDSDHFRFEAKKGDQLVFEARAARDGSPLDAVLSLRNPSGREVATGNDHFGADPFIAYTVTSDGPHTLSVRDLKYRGAGNFFYRVTAGAIPYIEAIFPIVGKLGGEVTVTPSGFNLSAPTVPLKLDPANPSPRVKVVSPAGESNAVAFDAVPFDTVAETEPNDTPDKATAVTLPVAVNGRIEKAGDEDVFRFKLEQPMKLATEVHAERYGSPIDALLTLTRADGTVVMQNDDAIGADARIVADLPAGEYAVKVQDLLYGSSPRHVYRLTLAPDAPPPQDFALRFTPDTPRITQGGQAKFWCEVVRANGFSAPVTVSIEGLPPGVTCPPVTIAPATSGVFTLSAAPDAQLGSFPIRVTATAPLNNQPATRGGQPEIGSTVVRGAYLTVLGPAPFAVKAMDISPQQLEKYAAELDALEEKLSTLTPELASAQAEWEKTVAAQPKWITLKPTDMKSIGGVRFFPQRDGSVIAGGPSADKDTYTFVAESELKGITAVRLDVLSHPNLPAKGPGRAANGNFVLSTFSVQATSKEDADQSAPLAFANAFADYSQPTLDPNKSFDDDQVLGWAVADQFGKDHWAIFPVTQPAGYEGGTTLAFTLKQDFGSQHTIGGLRLSVTTHEKPAAGVAIPAEVEAALKIPADQRNPEQQKTVTRHFLSLSPQTAELRARADMLRSIVGPSIQISRLEALLTAPNEKVDAAQAHWEQVVLTAAAPKLSPWHVVGPFQARTNDAAFKQEFGPEKDQKDKDGKIDLNKAYGMDKLKWAAKPEFADGQVHPLGATPRSATYLYRTIHADVPMSVALSLGSDDTIKLWHNGRQVLANEAYRGAAADQEKVSLNLAPGENTILLKISNGESGSAFYFKLGDQAVLPENIAAILKSPAGQRNDAQKAELRAYYRSIDPSLKQPRDRLATLKTQFTNEFPPVLNRLKPQALAVQVVPQQGFAGPVTVTLEGYTAGRDPNTRMPLPITNNIGLQPVTVQPSDGGFGVILLTPTDKSELGTRNVVLRAEGDFNGVKWVQYSPAFPLTIKE